MRPANPAHFPARFYFRTATLASIVLTACACQTAQKPASLLPPVSAPAIQAAAPASATGSVPARPAAQKEIQSKAQNAAPSQTQNQVQADSPQKPAATDATSPASSPASDPVADLIAKVEKDYQSGLANYHAGKTEDAKQNFDNAFNALLESNLDIRSDDRLQKQFDRMVEGVNQLELGGLDADEVAQDAQADAQQPQQKSEPAPIDVTNDETNGVTPAADARIKAKAEAEIKHTHSDLPLMMTDQVAGFISYFSGRGRGVFERAFARSGRYHDMIVSTLKEEGVPQDLIYLAQAESGFHPLAVSRVGARGIWQFMASRGRGYGLYHNQWVDDRQDPEKSTRAAAHHLKDLYAQFGDWYLAMAAYNSGPGTVQAAVKRTGYADFWELYRRNVLPKETRNYVPIILAVTIMTKNPSQYGLSDVSMDDAVKYDTLAINYPVDLRLAAECVNSTPAQLQELNPSLLRLTTPREGKFELHLPAGTKDQYETAIATIPADMRLWWRYHTVQSGDTLASLARNYHVTAKSISDTNHLDGAALETDARLVIPVAPGKHPASDTATYARRITRYKVHRGDTVETVAENFGVSPQMIRRWNGLRGDSLSGRKVVALHLPVSPTHETEVASARTGKKSAGSGTTQTVSAKTHAGQASADAGEAEPAAVLRHTVKSGETLYSIATTYRTTVAALKRNNGNVAVLHPGMILIVSNR
jgi:membrane-bound lytic murein transglycosylase D